MKLNSPLSPEELSKLCKALEYSAERLARFFEQGVLLAESLEDEELASSRRKIADYQGKIRRERERIGRIQNIIRRKRENERNRR